MDALCLHGVLLQEAVLLLLFAVGVEVGLVLYGRELRGYVGEDEELGVLRGAREHVYALVGELYAVVLLVDDEVEWLHGLWHLAVVVRHVFGLNLEQNLLDALLAEVADEWGVFWERLVDAEERESAVLEELFGCERLLVRVLRVGLVVFPDLFGVTALCGGNLGLGLYEQGLCELALRVDRWNFPPISVSMRQIPDSSNVH